MRAGPFCRQIRHVQIDAGFGAPVNVHWPFAVLSDGMFDDGLDWRKAGATSQHDDRFLRVFTQEKAAMRAVEAQDVAYFHARKHLVGEQSAGHVADVQLQQRVIMRGVGQRETSLLAILEQDVDVLTGEELQALGGGEFEIQGDDIRRQFFQPFNARGQGFDRNVTGHADLFAFDAQIGLRTGTAEEGQPGGFFLVLEGMGLRFAMVNRAVQHFSLAGTTGTVLAAIGHGEALTQGGVENGFIGIGNKLLAAGLNGNLVAHRFPLVVGYNAGVQKILIVGSGDVARRILPLLLLRYRVLAVLRDPAKAQAWRSAGAQVVTADLDQPQSLHRLAGLADAVLHLAPPPNSGETDSRTRHLLATLSRGKSLPRSLIYVSTTGVYGDCAGAEIDEIRRLNPESTRAGRRVDAEMVLRAWGLANGVRVAILRAPGIYAADRLPLERLENGLPALSTADDVFTNHIHADDLARACVAALRYGRPNRAVNVVDDTDLRMGDYFDKVAAAFDLPKVPRLPRAELARQVSPMQLSFMRESRRITNQRLKKELKLRLRYPTVDAGLRAALKKEDSC